MCVEGLASDRATDAVASYAGQMTTVDVNKMMAKVVPAGFTTRLTLAMGLSHRHVGCMCLATSMCMLKLFNSVVSLSKVSQAIFANLSEAFEKCLFP